MPTDERDVVHASRLTQAGFTIIPNVVMMRRDLSPLARLIYGYLKHLAWKNGNAVAETSLQVICRDLGAAENTVRKAISELRVDGLIQSRRRGQGRPNQYVIHEPKDDQSETSDHAGQTRSDRRVSHSLKEEKSEERENASHFLAVQGNREAPKRVEVQGRNLPWDAIVTATKADSIAERGLISKALETIRKLVWRDLPDPAKAIIEAAQFEQVIADAIKDHAEIYERTWPTMELTPTALAKNWTRIIVSSTHQQKFRSKGGLTSEGILAMQSHEEGE